MSGSGRVIVGLSGGVDSSVSALLLQEAGYEVEGLFMKNWEEDDGNEYCTAKQDLQDAQAVADRLKIPLHQANFAAEYWDNVFDHFLAEYQAGRTPNPDILCNREIKFKVFLDYALLLGADFIATGHYARLRRMPNGQVELLKGLDANKDQSYFLQSVSAEQFERCLFPVGELEKRSVRARATDAGLVTHDKKDSTGICFIGERRFNDFLKTYLPSQPGEIRSTDGAYLGQHQGLMYHTLGQRQGLGIGGVRGTPDAPWYVAGKNLRDNTLTVCQGHDHPSLLSKTVTIAQLHWVNAEPKANRVAVKLRYRQADQFGDVAFLDPLHARLTVTFDEPQRAATPGQWACFYDGDICLGGGVIESSAGITP
jgi:tRNA-specific 2-thiouridylase